MTESLIARTGCLAKMNKLFTLLNCIVFTILCLTMSSLVKHSQRITNFNTFSTATVSQWRIMEEMSVPHISLSSFTVGGNFSKF